MDFRLIVNLVLLLLLIGQLFAIAHLLDKVQSCHQRILELKQDLSQFRRLKGL